LDIPCKIPLEEKRPPQLQILNLSSWIYIYIHIIIHIYIWLYMYLFNIMLYIYDICKLLYIKSICSHQRCPSYFGGPFCWVILRCHTTGIISHNYRDALPINQLYVMGWGIGVLFMAQTLVNFLRDTEL
jgi:hypothetical protein